MIGLASLFGAIAAVFAWRKSSRRETSASIEQLRGFAIVEMRQTPVAHSNFRDRVRQSEAENATAIKR